MAWLSLDRDGLVALDDDRRTKRFYTTEQLGQKQSVTPEGFLLCQDVPLARTGVQIYGEHELPGLRGRDGIIRIMRDEAEVFRPETIRSYEGKPVTNDHPPEKVTPDNWMRYAVGTVLNVRRGDGRLQDNSFLYGDLLITQRRAINDIRQGKREVSVGYDAEYEQTHDGEGRQFLIVANHVALVKRGRCGPLCYIGDEAMPAVRVRNRSFADRIMTAFRAADEAALVEELDKVTEMLGEQVSGEGSDNTRDADGHQVTINLHGHPGAGGVASGGGTTDQPPPNGSDPKPAAAAAAGGEPTMAEIVQRLDRIEQAIVLLAQGEDDNGDDPDLNDPNPNPNDDRAGFGDESAGPPPSDDPEQRPGNALPYGAGTQGQQFESPQLGTQDRRRRTTRDAAPAARQQHFVGDSSSMQQAFTDTLARAEMLVPGASTKLRMPTFDAKTPARTTFDTLCNLRRNILTQAYQGEAKPFVESMLGGNAADFRGMTCDAVAITFNGASEMARSHNNSTVGRPRGPAANFGQAASLADINKKNRERYGLPA